MEGSEGHKVIYPGGISTSYPPRGPGTVSQNHPRSRRGEVVVVVVVVVVVMVMVVVVVRVMVWW